MRSLSPVMHSPRGEERMLRAPYRAAIGQLIAVQRIRNVSENGEERCRHGNTFTAIGIAGVQQTA